jgi:FkbM family methyltransferase
LAAQAARRLPALRGKARLARHFMNRDGRALDGHWELRLRGGTRFELPRCSEMSWTVAFQGSYDAALQRAALPYLVPGTLIVDVGASLGLWTVPLTRAASRMGSTVWAIEPHPENARWLRRNLCLNGLDEVVTVHQCALGDRSSAARLSLGEAHDFGAGNVAISVDDSDKGVEVSVRRLDDLPRDRRVSFMKLDVEGYELHALRGAQRLLNEDRPVILGEFSQEWLEARGEELRPFLAAMEELGYETLATDMTRSLPWRPLDRVDFEPLGPSGPGDADNLLLRPRVPPA